MGTLSTSGTDTLRRYLYSGFLSYRTDSRYLGWGASFALNTFVPIFTAGVYSYTVPYGDIYESAPGRAQRRRRLGALASRAPTARYWDKRIRGYAQVSYAAGRQPLGVRPLDRHVSLSPWIPIARRRRIGRSCRPAGSSQQRRRRLALRASGKSYDKSISPENARLVAIVGSLQPSAGIGSPTSSTTTTSRETFTQIQLTAEWREYRSGAVGAQPRGRASSSPAASTAGDEPALRLPTAWAAASASPGTTHSPTSGARCAASTSATVYGDWFYLGSRRVSPAAVVDRPWLWAPSPSFARYLSASRLRGLRQRLRPIAGEQSPRCRTIR